LKNENHLKKSENSVEDCMRASPVDKMVFSMEWEKIWIVKWKPGFPKIEK